MELDELESGDATRIDFRCSKATKRELQKIQSEIDPDMSWEDLMHVFIREHGEDPRRLEKHHY